MYAIPVTNMPFAWGTMRMTMNRIIEPKIQLGSILALGAQLLFLGGLMVVDHVTLGDVNTRTSAIQEEQERVKMALPLTAKEIEINAARIQELEAENKAVISRLEVLEQFEEVTRSDLQEVKENMKALNANGSTYDRKHIGR